MQCLSAGSSLFIDENIYRIGRYDQFEIVQFTSNRWSTHLHAITESHLLCRACSSFRDSDSFLHFLRCAAYLRCPHFHGRRVTRPCRYVHCRSAVSAAGDPLRRSHAPGMAEGVPESTCDIAPCLTRSSSCRRDAAILRLVLLLAIVGLQNKPAGNTGGSLHITNEAGR